VTKYSNVAPRVDTNREEVKRQKELVKEVYSLPEENEFRFKAKTAG